MIVFTVSGHLDHFHIGAIINNAAMSIDVQSLGAYVHKTQQTLLVKVES